MSDRPRKIRVVSDGTVLNTRIVDDDTGEDLRLPFAEISWRINAATGYGMMTLVAAVRVDLVGAVEAIYIDTPTLRAGMES